ncbi:unnamed protein product [Ectocarpus fasciculatus]
MPAGEGARGQDGSAATLVRSDQDSGMALVKSKDGRTKWLTVSTDPTSTPPSSTWDERVRTWASMLGVCAPPPSPPSSKRHNHGTPLPTPPPDSPAWGSEERGVRHQDKQQQQKKHWPSDRDDESTTAAAAVATDNTATTTTGTNSTASATTATSPRLGGAASTARRKPVATGKRVGSFARGFLLGLGGGGSGGGGGGSGGGASKRSKSPTGSKPAHAGRSGKGAAALVAPASTLPPQTREAGDGSMVPDGDDDDDADMAVMPSTPVETMTMTAAADHVTGAGRRRRQRWVKGAPPSPGDSDDSDSDGDATGRGDKGGNEGVSPGGPCSLPAAAAAAAPAAAGGDGEGMEWLETGPGGNVAAKANSGGTKTIGGGGGGGSKKKKKNRGKGKGGGGGGGAKPTKNGSSSCPSAAPENKTTSTQPMPQASGRQEPCREAAATSTRRRGTTAGAGVKAKRAKGGKKLSVSFGRVNLVEFTRDVGGCGVPSDGTWGLALGLPFRETVVDVDGYETSRSEILEERTSELSRKQRHLSTGETRQFDYRPVGEKNPLFYRLGEKDRRHKLLDYACFHKSDLEEADRDNEAVQTPDNSDGSGGKGTSDFDAYSHKVSHADFVDKSQEASVELTALRDSRKSSQGCSCSYVRADKLNLAKLRAELTKR